MQNYFNNSRIIQVLLKWKWHLLIVAILAFIAGAIISSPLFMPPKFKSSALVFPTNLNSYSNESTAEQLIQWYQAKDIKDSIIRKFELNKHYKLDSAYKYYNSTMMYLYNKHIKTNKTQFESIEISVLDKDPVRARDMVLSIIDFCNKKIAATQGEKFREEYISRGETLEAKMNELDSVEKALAVLRSEYGLFDFESQAAEITKGYLGTVDGGGRINREEVLKSKKSFEEKSGELAYLQQRRENILDAYHELELERDQSLYQSKRQLTYSSIISPPDVPDKKAWPVRWLITVYSVFTALAFALIVIALIEGGFLLRNKKA